MDKTIKNRLSHMLSIIQTYHAHQTRNGGTLPYWVHCKNVGDRLQAVLSKTKEGSAKERWATVFAGYGHDLYEDTTMTRQTIVDAFGQDVDDLIWQVTKPGEDGETALFVSKLGEASERAALIKLADIEENITSSTVGLLLNGVSWTTEFLVPVVNAQWEFLKDKKFYQFPEAAQIFKNDIEQAWQTLHVRLCQERGV